MSDYILNNNRFMCSIDGEDEEKVIDTAYTAGEAAQRFFDTYIDGYCSTSDIDGTQINVTDAAGAKYQFEARVVLEPVATVKELNR